MTSAKKLLGFWGSWRMRNEPSNEVEKILRKYGDERKLSTDDKSPEHKPTKLSQMLPGWRRSIDNEQKTSLGITVMVELEIFFPSNGVVLSLVQVRSDGFWVMAWAWGRPGSPSGGSTLWKLVRFL
jgi:hypothetical protein